VLLGDTVGRPCHDTDPLRREEPGQAVGGDGDDRARAGSGSVREDRGERGDRDPVGPAGLDAGLDGGADVRDVDVHVVLTATGGVDADDHEAVAEGGEPFVQTGDRALVGVGEEELDLAAGAGRRLVREVLARVPVAVLATGEGRPGRFHAGHGGHQRVQDEAEAGAAGVHHSGVAEDGELLRRRLEGGPGTVGGRADDVGEVGSPLVDGGDGGRRAGTGHGEERPFLGVGHRGVGGVGRLLEGGGERRTVGRGLAGQMVGEAAEELGEDRARVAPGSEDGAAGEHRPGRLGGARALAVERGDSGLGGEQEVGAGVAVGHGEDVEIVETAPGLGQDSDHGPVPLTDRGVIQRLQHGRRVPMTGDRTRAHAGDRAGSVGLPGVRRRSRTRAVRLRDGLHAGAALPRCL
jgi:hypothetical protein